MINVLILGAYGQIARVVTTLLLQRSDVNLTLYLRRAQRLDALSVSENVHVLEGDVLDAAKLRAAVSGQDVIYANLAGDLEQQANAIKDAMREAGVRRLIFISSMGIYDEVPGEHHGAILDPYRNAARVIENTALDYTIVRPAWLDDRDEIQYGTTQKGETFRNAGKTVSRKSVADLVVKLVTTPAMEVRRSLGVHYS